MKCPLERKRFIGREWLFKRLLHCVESGQKGVVIVGDAGCGKTATCCEIVWPTKADSLLKLLNQRLLAYHFCNAFEATSSSAGQFVLSLTGQLLTNESPRKVSLVGYRQMILTELDRKRWLQDPALCEADPMLAFRKLIAEPLAQVRASIVDGQTDASIFLMIDSLHDRCSAASSHSGSSDFVSILELLAEFQEDLPPWLMLLCTSRRQCKCIAKKLSGFRRITLDDVQRPHIIADINRYVVHRLENLPLSKVRPSIDAAGLTNMLAIKSNGCFLYLEMVMDAACDNFLSLSRMSDVPSTLNGLYLWICDQLFKEVPFHTMRSVFSVLLASRRPLSLKSLYQSVWTCSVDLSWTTFLAAVKRVSRLLWTDETMCLLFHSSFAEWLSDIKHSTQKYVCQTVTGHGCLSMFYSFKASTLTESELVDFAYHLSKMQSAKLSLEHLAMWMKLTRSNVEKLVLRHPVCDRETTRLLLEAGALLTTAVNVAAMDGSSTVSTASWAVKESNLEHGDHSSLIISAQAGCVACTHWWLTVGQSDVNCTDGRGNSALFLAAKRNHRAVCELLLKTGCDVNMVNADGWTSLRVAALQGHLDTLQLLLQYDSVVDHCGADGRTALRAAAWAGHEHCCAALIKAGAVVDLADCDGRTPLITAAFNGHLSVVEMLASAGADLNHCDRDGRTALMVATVSPLPVIRRTEVVRLLLQLRVKVGLVDKQGRTALHYAAMEGLSESCALLTRTGVDLNAEDENNCTPLMLAACYGRFALVQFLLSEGANMDTIDSTGRTVLTLAASQGNPDVVSCLLKAGLDEMHKDNNGWVPMHYAAFNGHVAACTLLCQRHVESVDIPDNEGRTPLMLATEEGHLDVAKCLLNFSASPYRSSLDGRTALHLAASKGSSELCYLLISHSSGSNLDVFDIDGRTSVYYATLEDHMEIVEMLLSFGADPNIGDLHGRTPLHVASWLGSTSIVKLLHRHGVNLDTGDRENRTALMIAVWRNNQDVVKLLLDLKADPNVQCHEGATALNIAVQEGNESIVKLFLQFNADISLRDCHGRTAVDVARLAKNPKITSLLESAQDSQMGTYTTLSGSSKKSAESKSSSGYQSLLVYDEPPKVAEENSEQPLPLLDLVSCLSTSSDNDATHSPPYVTSLSASTGKVYGNHPAYSVHVALVTDTCTSTDEDACCYGITGDEMNMSDSSFITKSCLGCRHSFRRSSRRNLIITNPRYRRNTP